MYVFKITISRCDKQQIGEASKLSFPEMKRFRIDIVRKVKLSKNTLVCSCIETVSIA